jgi:hypothetical protein
MSSSMFAERSLTPRSDFSVDDDDDNSDTSSVAFNAVQYAIELVHEAAAPHASAAQAVMHDYDCVANLCRACLPNGAYQDLCAALRTIVMAANKQQRYAHMCQVGLPHAFKALFEYLSSHFCGTAAGAPSVSAAQPFEQLQTAIVHSTLQRAWQESVCQYLNCSKMFTFSRRQQMHCAESCLAC